FSPAASYPAGTRPDAVVTADFNNDGHLDLATANGGGGTVSVLLGNPNGTFQLAQTSAAGSSPYSLAVGDFNAAGNLDLATENNVHSSYDSYDAVDGGVSILLGNGDGTFGPPVRLSSGTSLPANSIATGDLNADGKLDLVVTSADLYWLGNHVSVLLG